PLMLKVLGGLSDQRLTEIGKALRAGRLRPPFTALALQRYAEPPIAAAIAVEIQALAEEGLKTEHLALLVETLAGDRARAAGEREAVDLVWSGPEAPGVANRDTAVVVREL